MVEISSAPTEFRTQTHVNCPIIKRQ